MIDWTVFTPVVPKRDLGHLDAAADKLRRLLDELFGLSRAAS